ncbi:MAG: NUDIX domain-containing protein [Clostridia bacterium]|nr:NUDIX domain-containing protein [Clostridia bacterium]
MEKWDVLNAKGEPTGRRVNRGRRAILRAGEYHSVVHIWITDSKGRLLIQRRSEKKNLMPGEWAATGGATIAGETPFASARRELYEELSIRSNENTLKKVATIRRRNSILTVWHIQVDLDETKLRLQRNEVAQVRWVTREEFEKMIAEGRYHNYGREYFQVVLSAIYGEGEKKDESVGRRTEMSGM